MLNKIKSVIHPGRWRFKLITVALFIFGISFLLFLFNYVRYFILSQPFPWAVWWEYFPNFLLSNIVTTLFSYFTLNYFYFLFNQKKRFAAFILPVCLCIAGSEVFNLLIDYFLPLQSNINNPLPLSKQLVSNLVIGIFYSTVVLLLAYITHLRDERIKHRQLQEQKLKLEVEKAQAELKFLKSQINPHFLHNTLNSFYARSLPHSQELADSILTLSEIMRYALHQSNTTDGKVLLKDEIRHLQNVININQFRFRNNLNIQLQVKGEVNDTVIIPFVLITLVENIFKHGDLSNPAYAIKICIEVKDGKLKYYSQNKKKTGSKELSTGIGLDNIRKRLQLTYTNNFDLIIKDEATIYTTELIIYQL